MTPVWICIDNSAKRRHPVIRRRRKVLYQISKVLEERLEQKIASPSAVRAEILPTDQSLQTSPFVSRSG
jgi:hypothetical protein